MVNRRTVIRTLPLGLVGTSGCATVANRLDGRSGSRPSGEQTTAGSETQATTDGATSEASNTSNGDETGTSQESFSVSEPSGYLTDLPTPTAPSEFEYPRMGSADTDTVTLYGNWKCPYTREFVVQDLADLARSYVATGRVSIEFRTLAYLDGSPNLGPDAPRASWAGLAVWEHDPSSFWAYFTSVFQNQPPEAAEWATLDQLEQFMDASGVDNSEDILEDVHGGTHDGLVRESGLAAHSAGIDTIPRLEYDDTVVAPNLSTADTHALFEDAADD